MLGAADLQDPMLERVNDKTGLAWLAPNAKAEFGSEVLAIGGESAGATLAAVTIFRMRESQFHGPEPGPYDGANFQLASNSEITTTVSAGAQSDSHGCRVLDEEIEYNPFATGPRGKVPDNLTSRDRAVSLKCVVYSVTILIAVFLASYELRLKRQLTNGTTSQSGMFSKSVLCVAFRKGWNVSAHWERCPGLHVRN